MRKTPKQLLVYDWETYYAKDYSLSKMSTLDYIMDRRFQPICLALKVDNKPTECIKSNGTSEPQLIREALMDNGWEQSIAVAHNNRFDAAINRFRLDMPAPALYGCTRYMARAVVRPYVPTVRLKDVAEYYKRGEKGSQRETYVGYRLGDFSKYQLDDYMAYCAKDVDLCHAVFGDMLDEFPMSELENIDIVLRMYLHPMFRLNERVLTDHLRDVRQKKAALLARLPAGVTRDELMSNPKFALVLDALGAEVPMKISPRTGKEAPAFAKTDPGFKELLEDGSPSVQAVCAARIGVKSTQEETRTERMIDIARKYSWLAVPLVYAGAHTFRYAGDEKINLQNPARGSMIRKAMEAPPGYEVTCADYAQIEARIAATLAGCDSLIEAFRDPDRDPYAETASDIYGLPIDKKNFPKERFVGKVSTLQLQYQSGWRKLQATLAKGEGGKGGVVVTDSNAQRIVDRYRTSRREIPKLWETYHIALERMLTKESFDLPGGCQILLGMLELPNGFFIPYHNLRRAKSKFGWGFEYQFGREWRKLYGGKFLENKVQALAALLIREAMVRLYRRGVRVHLQVHDDISVIHRIKDRERVVNTLYEEMLKVPSWLPDLPLEVEIATGPNYLEVH